MAGSFERLDRRIQRWIHQKKWVELRDIQDRAIPVVLDETSDLLIIAGTADGKTEAAFLPVLTSIAGRERSGFSVLYISPLKALINDQFGRLEELCESLEVDVVRWHGDAPQAGKEKAVKNPRGIAQITPESIEALLVRRPATAKKLFQSIDYVIIDELHYFLEGPRGLHLSVLLNRLDALSERRPRRIGLSATVGDVTYARRYLNWNDPDEVTVLTSRSGNSELLVQIKGYVEDDNIQDADGLEDDGAGGSLALDRIADDIHRVSKGSNNLIFVGSRRRVESITDRLRTRCEKNGTPNEFFAHHGSLSKEVRQELEKRLRDGLLPTTAIATTTLELGIDLGSIVATGQVGAPMAMSSLRQRVGRSGRREGQPSIMRMYVRERRLNSGSDPLFRLRLDLVRGIASIHLLIERYIEPPTPSLVTSTVVLQQTLSIIAERGGAKADVLFGLIAGKSALSTFPKADYVKLLRQMANENVKLIEQAPNGSIMLGELGERLINKRDFYAMFETQDEWRVVHGTETLGTVPLSATLGVGGLIAFAGKRWRIEALDDIAKVVTVVPHRSAKIPPFESLANENVATRLVEEMRAVLEGEENYPYLDKTAVALLKEARDSYRELGLHDEPLVKHRDDVHLFFWVGSQIACLIALGLQVAGMSTAVNPSGVITLAGARPEEVRATIGTLARTGLKIGELADVVQSLRVGKWDEFVPPDVLKAQWCRVHEPHMIDVNYAIVDMAHRLGIDLYARDLPPGEETGTIDEDDDGDGD